MKITEALVAEHVVFHTLFDHLEHAAPKLTTLNEVRALAALLDCLLAAHARAEDELIIAPLEHCFEQIGHCDSFHDEHDLIEGNLKRARSARALPQAKRHLLEAVHFSRQHFDKEERIVFPMAERVLKSKTLTALGKSWSERRKA